MLNRSALMLVVGAAIFALDASAASAQDTTRTRRRSTTRIPVKKEATGEVTVRVDSVTVYKTDTVTVNLPGRTDTVMKTNTVVHVDTVTEMIPIKVPQIGGFYIGVGAGGSLPAAMFNDSDHPGWRVEVPAGFDFVGTPFGLRLNGGYASFSPHTWVSGLVDDAKVWNIDGDVKLRLATATPHLMRVQLYGLAGASYNHFKDILETDDGIYSIGDASNGTILPVNPDHSWHSGWGFNTGAGLEVGKGHTNVFAEVRFNRFKGQNSNISQVPLVIGLNWY
ncbi:MAG: hypothetical protein ACREPM_11425 [Gemmatimonadaceae bacterium]